MNKTRFARFAWGVLIYNLAVILWGAFVRATISGDGCGPHWPLCNGEVIPTLARSKTAIEFVHRISTGLVLPLVLALIFWSFRLFPKRSSVRLGAGLCVFFTITEALVGAVLVLFGLVAKNNSAARPVVMSVHLVNTFLLLASITLTAYWASAGTGRIQLRHQGKAGVWLLAGLAATLLLAVSGAITALGDTLYPVRSFAEGLRQDLSPTTSLLLKLRLYHPLIAVTVGVYLLVLATKLRQWRPGNDVNRFARWIYILFLVELGIGVINVWWAAPVAMQLIHLTIADLLWINLVLLTAAALSDSITIESLESLDARAVTQRARPATHT